ncbi:MAG: DUF4150 domain-containing protein [Saccharospirillum sp.]|nr:DUF4150 domain-containing protein [Saccharospirillum sp.]
MAVLINGRTAVHKDSNGKVLTVDVCLTKVGKYTVPIPYMNMAQSSDSDKTAGGVFIDGNPACHKDSTFSKSRGDEPGNKKGIRSRKKGDYASFIMGSANVQFEGTPAVRALELMVSNARNTPPSPLMQAVGLPPLPKQAASEDALAPFEGPYFEPVIQDGRSGLRTRELVASLEDPHSQPEHEAFTLSEAGEIILSGLHRAATHMAQVCKEATPWEHKPNDRILIPLCEARHSRIGEEAEHNDIALHALTLKRYLSPEPDADNTDALREGWLYVYVDGHLWREQQVTAYGYRDVDLHTWHGTDGPDHQQRPATGTLNDHLTVPHRLEGEPVEVQIAFSEVQWSWERISEFGGMKEDDARLLHKVEEDETLTDIARYYPDTTVEQLAELNGLDDPNQIQVGQLLKVRDLLTPPEDADERRTQRMGEPIDFDEAEALDFELIIADPLGVVEQLNHLIGVHLLSQQNIQAAMRGEHLRDTDADIDNPMVPIPPSWISYSAQDGQEGQTANAGRLKFPTLPEARKPGEHWREHCQNMTNMAQIANSFFFSGEGFEEADFDTRRAINKARDQTDQEQLEQWLYTEDRRLLRERIRFLRNTLVEFLQSEQTGPEDWLQALTDYSVLPAPRYIELWSRFGALIELTVLDPHTADQHLDLPARVREERAEDAQPGLELLANIINGEKEERWENLNRMLFPEEGEVDVLSPEPVDRALFERDQPAYDTRFSFSRLRDSVNEETNPRAPASLVKHIGYALEKTANLLSIANTASTDRPDAPTFRQEPIIGFMKSTDIEIVRNLHLLNENPREGSFVLGNDRVAQGIQRIEELHIGPALKRDARKSAANASEAAHQRGETSTHLSNDQGRVLISNNLADLTPYSGSNPVNPADMTADDIFKTYGKTGTQQSIHTVSGTLLVALPRQHEQRYHALSKQVGAGSTVVVRSFPAALLCFELQNFKNGIDQLSNRTLYEQLPVNLYYGLVLAAATLIATEALLQPKRAAALMHQSHTPFLQAMAIERPIKIGRLVFQAPLYRFTLLPGLMTVTASLGLMSGVQALKLGQREMGSAILVGTLAALAADILFLASSSVTAVVFVKLFAWLGWAFAAGAVAAFIVAWWFKPSPLEEWARFGPFPTDLTHRFRPDKFSHAESALHYLADLVFKPRITEIESFKIERPNGNSQLVVNLRVEVPGVGANSELEYSVDVFGFKQEDMYENMSLTTLALNWNHPPTEQVQRYTENGSMVIDLRYHLPWDISVNWLRRQMRIHSGFAWRLRLKHHTGNGLTLPASEKEGPWFTDNKYSFIHNIPTVPGNE